MIITQRLLTIDVGLRACGTALFENETLVKACLVKSRAPTVMKDVRAWLEMCLAVEAEYFIHAVPGTWPTRAVSEIPQVYFGGKAQVPAKDLLDLAAVVGCLAQMCYSKHVGFERVLPGTWKQQQDKKVVIPRIKKRLSNEELKSVKLAGAKSHNIWEAIGIGLWKLGRFQRTRYTGRGLLVSGEDAEEDDGYEDAQTNEDGR